ncbi:hypothetical protein BV375_01185 [Nostoc sp. 106C]|nr:hypothetical protein BV375_01185 [Nostoc sp. 106C]
MYHSFSELVSHQTQNRNRLRAWQQTVRDAAIKYISQNAQPVKCQLQITVVYYHNGITVRMDSDKMVKPIQDALISLVYIDDRQITDTRVRKTDLNGTFRVKGMSSVLAEGFCKGTEFLHIKIVEAPDHREVLQ